MKRELGTFERALVISDQYAPFHLVSVVRLDGTPPPPHVLKQALKVLQNHHPFLTARLLKENGRYYFASLVEPGLPFHVLPRWNDDHWLQVTEVELGTRMDVSTDPMFRCTYLFDLGHHRAEIILTFFHPILDASSIGHLLHELLSACASFMDQRTVTVFELPPGPPVESRFPSAFRGLGLALHTLRYMIKQLGDGMLYRIRTRGKRTPPLHRDHALGHVLSAQFPENLVAAVSNRAQLENVPLNTVLNAAMLIAVNRHLYAGKHVPMRTFSFVDLRPHVVPPLASENLACYVSMLRFTASVEGGTDLWYLAHDLYRRINASIRSGDMFVSAATAESLMKKVIRLKSFRIGSTGLNFNGTSQLQTKYEEILVRGVHSYISAYDLGPEFAGQAQIFDGRLFWDFIYLDADMSQDEAKAIVEEIKSILNAAIMRPLFKI